MPTSKNLELETADKEALHHYRVHVAKFGVEPTQRQMADYLGIYPNAARHRLLRLLELGYLAKRPDTRIRLKLSLKGKEVKL